MIVLEPRNYEPAEAEVETARKVLAFAHAEITNGLTAAILRAQEDGIDGLDDVLRARSVDVDQVMQGADDLVLAAVERAKNRTEGTTE